jgi:predicted nucleic acid-binding protein
MPIVIDANIAIRWFGVPKDAIADSALGELCEQGAVVPALWRWEVQDVLRRLHAAGHLPVPVEAALDEMAQLPITVDDQHIGLFGDELALAKQFELSVYDASYLELAVRRGIRLATIDKKLASAAKTAGVAYVPASAS